MEPNQFDELITEIKSLKSENLQLKKDVKLIKSLVIGVSVYLLILMAAYGLGFLFGVLKAFAE
jgi:hypothetical protein